VATDDWTLLSRQKHLDWRHLIMRRISLTRIAPVVIALAAALALATALGLFGALAGNDESQSQAASHYRWRRLSIELPANANMTVIRGLPIQGFHEYFYISISPRNTAETPDADSHELKVDADTGEILIDTLSPYNAAAATFIRSSIQLTDADPAVWPFVEADTSGLPLVRWGNVTVPEPVPSSGIVVTQQIGFCVLPCSPMALSVTNGYSSMGINAENGELTINSAGKVVTTAGKIVTSTGKVLNSGEPRSADEAAFQRIAASIEVAAAAPAPASSP
jgi:hypothetical protein